VTKPEWGLKRICPSCNARYYDMRKNPPVCPTCSTVFDPESVMKVRRRAAADEKARKAQPATETTPDDIEDIAIEGDGEDSVIEDAEELGDEDTELEEVVELDDDAGADNEH